MNIYEINNQIVEVYNNEGKDSELFTELLLSLVNQCTKITHPHMSESSRYDLSVDIFMYLYDRLDKLQISYSLHKYIIKVSRSFNSYKSVNKSEIDRSTYTSSIRLKDSSSPIDIIKSSIRYKSNSNEYKLVLISCLLTNIYRYLSNSEDILVYKIDESYYTYIEYLIKKSIISKEISLEEISSE